MLRLPRMFMIRTHRSSHSVPGSRWEQSLPTTVTGAMEVAIGAAAATTTPDTTPRLRSKATLILAAATETMLAAAIVLLSTAGAARNGNQTPTVSAKVARALRPRQWNRAAGARDQVRAEPAPAPSPRLEIVGVAPAPALNPRRGIA